MSQDKSTLLVVLGASGDLAKKKLVCVMSCQLDLLIANIVSTVPSAFQSCECTWSYEHP